MSKAAQFGLINYSETGNIGDEIQSLAVKNLLPPISTFIDREALSYFSKPGFPVSLVVHGWFCHRPESWPPSAAINPLLIGIHISPAPSKSGGILPATAMLTEPALKYLRSYSPVGARDQYTLDLLRAHNVECYLSACVSLSFQASEGFRDPDLIVVNDVDEGLFDFIKATSRKRVVFTTHTSHISDSEERFRLAQQLIELYSSASCVVTTRLHCALPCVGMNVPVLVMDQNEDVRFSGLRHLFYNATSLSLLTGSSEFNFDDPPPAKTHHHDLRRSIIAAIDQFVADTANDERLPYPFDVSELTLINNQNIGRLFRAAYPDG